jgi:hypothetical protein
MPAVETTTASKNASRRVPNGIDKLSLPYATEENLIFLIHA